MERRELYSKILKLRFKSKVLAEGMLSGDFRSAFRGRGIEFDEVREYSPGDEARLIDWNVSARMGTAYTKLYREERELSILLVVDCSASMRGGAADRSRLDTACLVASLIAFAGLSNNDRVGGVLFADKVLRALPPRKGRSRALALIDEMARARGGERGSDLSGALDAAGRVLKRKSVCVVISDFKVADYKDALGRLARRHDLIAIMIRDPSDEEFPATGYIEMEESESSDRLAAIGRSRRFREAYSSYARQSLEGFRRLCARYGASPLVISTTDDPAARLIDFFDKRRGAR